MARKGGRYELRGGEPVLVERTQPRPQGDAKDAEDGASAEPMVEDGQSEVTTDED